MQVMRTEYLERLLCEAYTTQWPKNVLAKQKVSRIHKKNFTRRGHEGKFPERNK